MLKIYVVRVLVIIYYTADFALINFKPSISEESKGLCMYDRNEVPCCTEKLELFQSWQKEGYVEGLGPYDALIGDIEDPKGWMKYIYEHQIRMEPKYVYSVRGDYGKSKWNFVCPTHHPVPTVAILLGMFEISSLFIAQSLNILYKTKISNVIRTFYPNNCHSHDYNWHNLVSRKTNCTKESSRRGS